MLSERAGSPLLDKLLGFDLVPLVLILLSKPEIEIREYAIKFLQLLLLKSPDKFERSFAEAGGFGILSEFMLTPRQLFTEIGDKIQILAQDGIENLHTQQLVSSNMMQIMLDASVCKFDNVNEMSPEN